MSDKSSYRSIFKSTSLFGGVQVFNIIIAIIRGKFVAVLLGPAGMGINGLFMTTIQMLQNITNLGLPQSAVRDIASSGNDPEKIAVTYTVFRRWIWFTALLGGGLTFFGAPFLSQYVFQNDSYAWAFRLLSVTFVFGAVSGGIYTLLRGLRRLKALASANVLGSLAGLLVAVPLFYFFGIQGIVPAILATAMANFGIALFFKNREVKIESADLNYKRTFFQGLDMAKLGISMSLSGVMASVSTFFLLTFIGKFGLKSDVGLYSAGQTILVSYVGMIFTAMSTDYFPRLTERVANQKGSDEGWLKVVDQQARTVIFLLSPVIILMLLTAPIIVRLLLSDEFLLLLPFITWACLGVFIKGIVFPIGFIFIAHSDNKLFLVSETLASGLNLLFCVLGYYFHGLHGLGFGYFVAFFIAAIYNFAVLKIRYNVVYPRETLMNIVFLFTLALVTVISLEIIGYLKFYWVGSAMFLLVASYCLLKLNKEIDFMQLVKHYTRKK